MLFEFQIETKSSEALWEKRLKNRFGKVAYPVCSSESTVSSSMKAHKPKYLEYLNFLRFCFFSYADHTLHCKFIKYYFITKERHNKNNLKTSNLHY